MGNQLALCKNNQSVAEYMEGRESNIATLLPENVDVKRFIKSAMLALHRNPTLLDCTIQSFYQAVITAAELNLDFSQAKGHAYLVPFKGSMTFMPGYRGLIALIQRAGQVQRVEAHEVYANDYFKMTKGTSPSIDHVPIVSGDRGESIGAYAILFYPNGSTQHDFMRTDELDAIKMKSQTARNNKGPWLEFPGEMKKKTITKRLAKYAPMDDQLAKAIEHDNAADPMDFTAPRPNSPGMGQANAAKWVDDIVNGPSDPGVSDADFTDMPPAPPETEEAPLPEVQSDDVPFMSDEYSNPDHPTDLGDTV